MNYIRHMNAFFTLVKKDERLTSSHVSLYLALFQYWNFNRFQNPFPVYRDNMMQLSKIGSKNTYHKCIKELHQLKYIYYHPSPSKFLPVKISIGRLDMPEAPISRFKQLDLFNENAITPKEQSLPNKNFHFPSPSGEGGRRPDEVGEAFGDSASPNFDTVSVPILTAMGTDFDTVPVPKMGHNLKHKHFIKESKPPSQKIFNKNEKLSEAINGLAGVPNSVQSEERSGSIEEPTQPYPQPHSNEVAEFFKQNNYPEIEAQKFFNHYKAIGWKIKGITPIEDWPAAAHKWMINAKQWQREPSDEANSFPYGGKVGMGAGGRPDTEGLYKLFLAGQNIFKQITPDHFTELELKLTDEIMQHAWKERINQLTGSNQNSILQLLQAYQDNKQNDPLLMNDQVNLISLAKRIAVLKHFKQQSLSSSGLTS